MDLTCFGHTAGENLILKINVQTLTCLYLGIYVKGLIWGVYAASLVVFFTNDKRQQLAIFILCVTDGTHREPAQLAVL